MFLTEPQAAAVNYALAERVERGSTIAVYDLGGGTFDAGRGSGDRRSVRPMFVVSAAGNMTVRTTMTVPTTVEPGR